MLRINYWRLVIKLVADCLGLIFLSNRRINLFFSYRRTPHLRWLSTIIWSLNGYEVVWKLGGKFVIRGNDITQPSFYDWNKDIYKYYRYRFFVFLKITVLILVICDRLFITRSFHFAKSFSRVECNLPVRSTIRRFSEESNGEENIFQATEWLTEKEFQVPMNVVNNHFASQSL